jgi:hypothetical protein
MPIPAETVALTPNIHKWLSCSHWRHSSTASGVGKLKKALQTLAPQTCVAPCALMSSATVSGVCPAGARAANTAESHVKARTGSSGDIASIADVSAMDSSAVSPSKQVGNSALRYNTSAGEPPAEDPGGDALALGGVMDNTLPAVRARLRGVKAVELASAYTCFR